MTKNQKIAALIEQNTGTDGVFSTILPGVFLLRASHPTAPVHTIYEPSLCFVAQGRKQVSAGSLDFTYEPGAALAVSVGLPVRGQVLEASPLEPFLCLRIELRQETFTGLHRNNARRSGASGLHPGMGIVTFSISLQDALVRTLQLLAEPQDARVLWPLLEKELSYHLLSECSSPVLSQLSLPTLRFQHIMRAVSYLRRHFRRSDTPRDLDSWVGTRTVTLHRDFKSVTGMSVLGYVRTLRLQESRRLLMLGIEDPTKLAKSTGYADASTFLQDYTATFHSTPVTDAEHWRHSSRPAGEE
ncbi:AraC family transcriptional regulator [Agrobacterium tumefaciens]|uniref:AraC family transcriptional regulator n=1 Tax=Agrobacterium tumefaciens TaxID=358 RepID=UPI00287EE3AD|nr:AraC family transcriptional regulator [Agrobacterium tumefaciens]MDS7593996.1 AraC family transcriptional regulator [Agrobacterium tumefaciens]